MNHVNPETQIPNLHQLRVMWKLTTKDLPFRFGDSVGGGGGA